MIQANEIRQGNWVSTPNQPFMRIDEIEIYSADNSGKLGMRLDMEHHPLTWYLKDVSPIPLTEEILLKCGGKIADSEKRQIELDRFLLRWLEAYKYWYVTDIETGAYITKIEFLHEWQNTFFVLNGQELAIES